MSELIDIVWEAKMIGFGAICLATGMIIMYVIINVVAIGRNVQKREKH